MNRIIRHHESARYWTRDRPGDRAEDRIGGRAGAGESIEITELADLKLILSEIIQADDLTDQTLGQATGQATESEPIRSLEELDKTRQE